jgi:alpha-1,3-rhamnosyltransferase
MIEQNYENMEMIIIDDGSSDNSIEIIESMIPLCKKRFKRFEFRHRENKGVSATLNEGIMWSKGKYLSPLASDDMAMPNKTSYLVDKLEKSGHKAAFGSVTDMMNGKLIFGEKSQKTIYKFYDLFLLKKFIHGTACLININSLKDIGLYNENIAVEDLYMWLKLTEDGSNLICYPKVLAKYRTHDNNTVKYLDIMYENLLNTINLYKENMYYNEALRNAKVILVKLVKNLDDYILTKSGLSKVKSINKTYGKLCMFDLSVDTPEMSYYTNNILSHNTVSAAIVILHFVLFNDDKGCMIVANKGKTVQEISDIFKIHPDYLGRVHSGAVRPHIRENWEKNNKNGGRCRNTITVHFAMKHLLFHCVRK